MLHMLSDIRHHLAIYAILLLMSLSIGHGQSRMILLEEMPRLNGAIAVSPDGSRIYLNAGQHVVFDATGKLIDRFSVGGNTLIPLSNGWFILSEGHSGIYMIRPDGTRAQKIVGLGGGGKDLFGDMTGWTSPCAAAVDEKKQLIFVIDTSMAQRDDRNMPDPWYSRIGVWDFEGNFKYDIHKYDAFQENRDQFDDRRVWYYGLAVDPQRERIYAAVRNPQEIWAFDYAGTLLKKVKSAVRGDGMAGAITILPDGRVAAGSTTTVQIFSPELELQDTLPIPDEVNREHYGVRSLASDASGRLYAAVWDENITFLRWSADLKQAEAIGPRYLRMTVTFPGVPVTAGEAFIIKTGLQGRPQPTLDGQWTLRLRPSDGSDLRWTTVPTTPVDEGRALSVTLPETFRGIYNMSLRYRDSQLRAAGREDQAEVKWVGAVVPHGATRSLSLIPSMQRRAYQQGEAIPLQLIRREKAEGALPPIEVTITLLQDGRAISTATATVAGHSALQIPAAITKRLAPGAYALAVEHADYACYALPLTIASGVPDSPMQRIMYHEMGGATAAAVPGSSDLERQLAFQQNWLRKSAYLGFTRETDRNMSHAWGHVGNAANTDHPGLAHADYYRTPSGGAWPTGMMHDLGTQYGVSFDSQMLAHCSGVRFRDYWFERLTPVLQRAAQSRERYPSFYGYNYNDEMFFGQWVFDWTESDVNWLKENAEQKFNGSMPDVYRYALRTMYDTFDDATLRANPEVKRTATPMWQFPAVEGSYAPEIYQNMSESYAHYLSEGYQLPWYAPHSGEFLRRPGLPLMNVATNAVGWSDYDAYLKNTLQILFRGVQGVGVSLLGPFDMPHNTAAVRTANHIAKAYGPIFAECPPLNEGALLYSYTQDITESRRGFCTPHWDSVLALYGCGLMTGAPLTIIYEEDIRAGWLLLNGKPRVPMLVLAGQKTPLPQVVQDAIARFTAAGGKIVIDAESRDVPGAIKINKSAFINYNQGYASDTAWPMIMPQLEELASAFRTAVAPHRRFPVDSDALWLAKNHFDGGAIHYLGLVSESEPSSWEAGVHWSLKSEYNYSVTPKTATITMPARTGVIYDVFEHTLVQPVVRGNAMTLQADLTVLPGKLYALAPAQLGAPRVATAVVDGDLHYRLRMLDARGEPLAARVPVRIRLSSGETMALDIYRGTDADGVFAGIVSLPVNAQEWTLTVTEMLGTKSTSALIAQQSPLGDLLMTRDTVEIFREDRLRLLLEEAREAGSMKLVMANANILTDEEVAALTTALQQRGIRLQAMPVIPAERTPGTYLAVGYMQGHYSQGDVLWKAWQNDLYPFPVSESVPGAGRGMVCALFSPRSFADEQAIALLGGDAAGLKQSIAFFIDWLQQPEVAARPAAPQVPVLRLNGQETTVVEEKLSERYGVRLDSIRVAGNGKHLLVTARGLLKNLAVLEDDGENGRLLSASRIGQGNWVDSPYISRDGATFGASVRETARYGHGFHLLDTASGREQQVFAGFGDMAGRRTYRSAVADDGNTLIVPGSYGVVCWKRQGDGWQEAWAIDYWKEFDKLDWPVHDTDERIPQFHAIIPPGADYAIIVFGETTNNAWIMPQYPYGAAVFAVNLADGTERWRFDVPILKELLFPTLYASPDGRQLLLQVMVGSWNKETFRFYNIDAATGAVRADWASTAAPLSFVVADGNGSSAAVYNDRRVEVREANGSVLLTLELPNQPLSTVFVAGGQGILTSDDGGFLTRYTLDGAVVWQKEIGGQNVLDATNDRIYAAGRDGRVRAFTADGALRWTVDCTPEMTSNDPMALVTAPRTAPLYQVTRPPTTTREAPAGVNLLANGTAVLKVGGTPGWMSGGKIDVTAEELTDGKKDNVSKPIIPFSDLYWDAYAGRQIWMEIAFAKPTDVTALTVYENPAFPDSFPTETVVQVWNEETQAWKTAVVGLFLNDAVNNYPLNLKGVTKLRYVPWGNYFRNFYTSEIEVR